MENPRPSQKTSPPRWPLARKAARAVRAALLGADSIRFHVDSPATTDVTGTRFAPFLGWALSTDSKPVQLKVNVAGRHWRDQPLDRPRSDVVQFFREALPNLDVACGFSFSIDLEEHDFESALPVSLEFRSGRSAARSQTYMVRRPAEPSLQRAHYKEVWNACASSEREAMVHVAGYLDESQFGRRGELTRDLLVECVGVGREDVVLEIGAGIGRVGRFLAPLCKEWIGTDVSENMLGHLRRRLADLGNVRTVALSGYDLSPIPDASIDLVYCTVVFMHLDEWERFNYLREGYRVLKPGGRMLVDNTNLLSEEGWALFLNTLEMYHPLARPANISKSSTPQELDAYFRRAGFQGVQQKLTGMWIITFARK